MTLMFELFISRGGSTLSIEANDSTAMDLCPPLATGMITPTEEFENGKSALKLSVRMVLFNIIDGVSMLKESLVRTVVIVSRDCNRSELTLLAGGLLLVTEMFWALLLFREFHDPFAASVVRTPATKRIS